VRKVFCATANVNPGPIAHLCENWQAGNADDQQARLNEVRDAFKRVPMIPALKAAIAHYSDDAVWRRVRPPLVSLNPDLEKTLVEELDSKGFAMPGLFNFTRES
jgi:4-hydroxy-tetrahydrodipicolinate synthase